MKLIKTYEELNDIMLKPFGVTLQSWECINKIPNSVIDILDVQAYEFSYGLTEKIMDIILKTTVDDSYLKNSEITQVPYTFMHHSIKYIKNVDMSKDFKNAINKLLRIAKISPLIIHTYFGKMNYNLSSYLIYKFIVYQNKFDNGKFFENYFNSFHSSSFYLIDIFQKYIKMAYKTNAKVGIKLSKNFIANLIEWADPKDKLAILMVYEKELDIDFLNNTLRSESFKEDLRKNNINIDKAIDSYRSRSKAPTSEYVFRGNGSDQFMFRLITDKTIDNNGVYEEVYKKSNSKYAYCSSYIHNTNSINIIKSNMVSIITNKYNMKDTINMFDLKKSWVRNRLLLADYDKKVSIKELAELGMNDHDITVYLLRMLQYYELAYNIEINNYK